MYALIVLFETIKGIFHSSSHLIYGLEFKLVGIGGEGSFFRSFPLSDNDIRSGVMCYVLAFALAKLCPRIRLTYVLPQESIYL